MTLRLIVLCLALAPTASLAQQAEGECDHKRTCPSGQILDTATKTCVAISS